MVIFRIFSCKASSKLKSILKLKFSSWSVHLTCACQATSCISKLTLTSKWSYCVCADRISITLVLRTLISIWENKTKVINGSSKGTILSSCSLCRPIYNILTFYFQRNMFEYSAPPCHYFARRYDITNEYWFSCLLASGSWKQINKLRYNQMEGLH